MNLKKKTEKKIVDLVRELAPFFDVQNYDISVTFTSTNVEEYAATIFTDHKYRRLNFKVYPIFFEQTLDEQRRGIIHELCHTLTECLDNCAVNLLEGKLITLESIKHANESSTSQMQQMISVLLEGDGQLYTKAYKNYLKK